VANDGQIVFEVTADGRHAIADIQDITRAIQRETRQWDNTAQQSTNNISNSFGGMLKKITAGFSAVKIGKFLLNLGKEAVEAASDLAEVQNVVDVTFGKSAGEIESWAKTATTAYGLTETQAKRYASTMGAMLKSSGMAENEIVTVSTDLAGLAADMASFYNLDFDTAFAKIRSGISGETMPLKELGIDLSVATLNAYALQQGLTKTFDQMSQGEQTMLRYQYLMSATADAQGDFARTSDGYANGVRQLETNLTTLKTTLGDTILPFINDILNGINQLFPETPRNDSLLHQIANIQLKKDEKIAEIEAIKAVANELIATLESIGTDTNTTTALAKIATDANSLDAASVGNWKAILSSLRGINGLNNLFGDGSNTGTIDGLAEALSGNSITTSKAEAWQLFLSTLSDNADAVSKLTGGSAEETKKWLEGLAESAGKLDPADAQAWQDLMTALMKGIDTGSEEGQQFASLLAQNYLALGSESDAASKGLAALGYSTDEIEEKQAAWLQTCKELANTIPGLSSIIDTNTGEVKGGIPALRAYADEWERTAKYQAEIDALKSAKDIYNENNNQAYLNADVTAKKAVAVAKMGTFGILSGTTNEEKRQFMDDLGAFMQSLVDQGEVSWEHIKKKFFNKGANTDLPEYLQSVLSLTGEAEEAMLAYAEASFRAHLIEKERPVVLAEIEAEEARVAEEYNTTTEALDAEMAAAAEAAAAMTVLERAASGDAEALASVETAVSGANEALTALADHVKSVRDSVTSSIDSTVKGFGKIQPASWAVKDLTDKLAGVKKGTDEWKELNKELEKTKSTKLSAARMGLNLEEQARYMEEYLANLEAARKRGVSNEVLAQLSDGSTESFDILAELAGATDSEVETINANYAKVAAGKKQLADELTAQQLTVDETYQSLQEKAKEAVAALDLGEEAKTNTAKTIQGIADGINEKSDSVKSAVDGIISQIERLNGFGINIDLGGFGNIQFTTTTGKTEGSGRFGMDYVPRDDYIMRLHEGEKVLSAQEASVYRGLANGSIAGVDLDALGGVMRDSVQPGGNVYLDGRIVGTVISDRQGKSYKSLQRSGWQA
jgi:hypothetical protein